MRIRVASPVIAFSFVFLFLAEAASSKTIAAGEGQSCGISNSGALTCWGDDSSFGVLGTGAQIPDTPVPQPVAGMSSGVTDVDLSVSGGNGATGCAVVNGGARCWGRNNVGQFGNGTTGNFSATPVPVTGLESGVTEISVGTNHACAVQNGAARCWGSGSFGKLGDDDNEDRLTPVTPVGLGAGVTDIATGTNHTCAMQSTVVLCWGDNTSGALGRPSANNDVPGAVVGQPGPAAEVTAGFRTTCMATTGGSAHCWGANTEGRLGTGNDLAGGDDPRQVAGLTSGVSDISGESGHFCAVKDGAGFCWGRGTNGQLGNGAASSSNAPVGVQGLTGISSISAGNNHSCASVGADKWCWGQNGRNQLGVPIADGSQFTVPVKVGGDDPSESVACTKAEKKLKKAKAKLKKLKKKDASAKKVKKAKAKVKKAKSKVKKAC